MTTKVQRKWNSLSEFLEFALGKSEMETSHRSSRRSGAGYNDWYGTSGIAEAKSMAFKWEAGANRIQRFRSKISIGNSRVRKQSVAREAGPGVVSMGRFVSGHPQPYIALVDSKNAAKGKGKVVKILVNLCVSGGISASTIEKRGAAVLALVDALEKTGRRVEVTVGMANSGNGRAHVLDYRVTVKQANQKLNLQSVAFAIAHPSMFRRFVFSAMECEDAQTRRDINIGSGYGYVAEFTDDNFGGVAKDVIYVPGAEYGQRQWDSEDSTVQWIKDRLADQGVVLK